MDHPFGLGARFGTGAFGQASGLVVSGAQWFGLARNLAATWPSLPPGTLTMESSGASDRPLLTGGWAVFDADDNMYTAQVLPGGTGGTKLTVFIVMKVSTTSRLINQFDYGASKRCWRVDVSSSKFEVQLCDNGSTIRKDYYSTKDVDDGDAHFLLFTWNAGTLSLYVDGAWDTTVTKTTDNALSGNAIYQSETRIRMKALGNNGVPAIIADTPSVYAAGVFNRVLSQSEIDYLYNLLGGGPA